MSAPTGTGAAAGPTRDDRTEVAEPAATVAVDETEETGVEGLGRRSLGAVLGVCAGIAAVLLAVVIAAGGLVMGDLGDHRAELVNRFDPALLTVQELTAAVVDQETGIRGYALAGRPEFLEPYLRGRAQEDQLVARLRDLLAPTSQVLGDLDTVEARIQQWRTIYAEPVLAATTTRTPAPPPEVGRAAFDQVRAALGVEQQCLLTLRDDAAAGVRSAATALQVVGVALAVVLAVGLAAVLLWLRRVVVVPSRRLAEEVRHVMAGDLHRKVAVRGPQEITELGRDVDAMRRAMLVELARIEAARRQLDERGRELERSNSDLEQFAYVASHDLQEPLRKVASFCQLLQRRYAGQLDDRADQYIDFAVDGAKRMQVLINDLLAFSRVGRTRNSAQIVDTGALLDRAVENLAGVLEESGGRVTHDELPRLAAEPALLTTVFQNLLGNSLKFRGQDPPHVHVSAVRDGDRWLVRFVDNGIGIDPEYAERIFAIFQRLHSQAAYPGTGIGLAMCRKIVEHHGGTMWLEPSEGPGSTFVVALPALPDDSTDPEETTDPADPIEAVRVRT